MQDLIDVKNFLVRKGFEDPETGVVLGTGLNKFIQLVSIDKTVSYQEILGFPEYRAEHQEGKLYLATVGNRSTIIMQGRFHAYEGYTMEEIVFPVRVMKMLGIENLFLSNAAGAINLNYKKGELVMISDHINLMYGNPLTGKNKESLGPRFPDMSEPYNKHLMNHLHLSAKAKGIAIKEGVYAAVNGPNLETRAEYRYLKVIGADLVGMSTVPEVIAANHMGLPCAAISVVTDLCDPNDLQPVNIPEIIAVAAKADEKLSSILFDTISRL